MRIIRTTVGAVREGRESNILPPVNEIVAVAAMFVFVLSLFGH